MNTYPINPKDINSNNKIRRAEKRIEFLRQKGEDFWTLNEIEKLENIIVNQRIIVAKRNKSLGKTTPKKDNN